MLKSMFVNNFLFIYAKKVFFLTFLKKTETSFGIFFNICFQGHSPLLNTFLVYQIYALDVNKLLPIFLLFFIIK